VPHDVVRIQPEGGDVQEVFRLVRLQQIDILNLYSCLDKYTNMDNI